MRPRTVQTRTVSERRPAAGRKTGKPPQGPRFRFGADRLVAAAVAAGVVAAVALACLAGLPRYAYDLATGGAAVPVEEGLVRSEASAYAHHPLVVTAPDGGDSFFVKVVAADGREVKAVFIGPGHAFHAVLDAGSYTIRYARGGDWRGEKALFGTGTTVWEYDSPLDFEPTDDDGYGGFDVVLTRPVGGKPADHRIDPSRF
jgi:hypothetical protein